MPAPSTLPHKPSLVGGWEGESEKREIQGLRAKPPPIFIAGVLEICLSLLILGRWTLRGPPEKEVTLAAPVPTDGHARPTLGKHWATSGLWDPGVSDPLSSVLLFKSNHSHSHPPKQGPQAQAWAQWNLEVGSAPKIKQFSTGRKGEVWGKRRPRTMMF